MSLLGDTVCLGAGIKTAHDNSRVTGAAVIGAEQHADPLEGVLHCFLEFLEAWTGHPASLAG